MHLKSGVVMAVTTLCVLASVPLSVAQSAQGANAPQRTPWASWGHSQPSSAPSLEFEPDHRVLAPLPHVAGAKATSESSNWSGYVDAGTQFTAVSGQWVVPAVQPAQNTEASGTWIGIDGFESSSVIQTGTLQVTSGGSTGYAAWYELYPDPPVTIGAVEPGDAMQASIFEDGPGTWTISLADLTSNQTTSGEVSYNGPGTSAEWIEEAPFNTVTNQVSTLADFGSVQFTGIGETASTPSGVTAYQTDMIDGSNDVIATTGPLNNNSFTIDYTGPNTAPATSPTTTTASVNPTSTPFGGSVTYAATVSSSGGVPLGNVTFAVGSTTLCTTGSLVNGTASCSASNAPVGSDTVTATYSGSTQFAASAGSTSLDVTATSPPPPAPSTNHGYWLVGSDGGIFTFGSAQFYGSTGALKLQRPVVGITTTADRGGYWLVASDGGIFSFNAPFYGSIPGLGIAPAGTIGAGTRLNGPIVGMVPSSDDGGYFLVGSDGGVFSFGDAKFEGSCPGIGGCSGAAVTVLPDASGNGYWLVTATGHVYDFGDAPALGQPGPQSTPVTSAVRTPDGNGYWILFANGTVDNYGDAVGYGDPAGVTGGLDPATAIFTTSDGAGYWVSTATGTIYAYGDAPNDGGASGLRLNGSIIAASGF